MLNNVKCIYYVVLYPLFLHSSVLSCERKDKCVTPLTIHIVIQSKYEIMKYVNMKFSYSIRQIYAKFSVLYYKKFAGIFHFQYSK